MYFRHIFGWYDVEQGAAAEISLADSFIHAASHWSIIMRLNQTFAQGKESRSALYLALRLPIRKPECEILDDCRNRGSLISVLSTSRRHHWQSKCHHMHKQFVVLLCFQHCVCCLCPLRSLHAGSNQIKGAGRTPSHARH
jgi:hypothetical protein